MTRREHLPSHPLRGALFENLAVLEFLKACFHPGERPRPHFHRDSGGNEADLVLEDGRQLHVVEIKSAATVSSDAMRPVANSRRTLGECVAAATLVYGGSEAQKRSDFSVIGVPLISEMIG